MSKKLRARTGPAPAVRPPPSRRPKNRLLAALPAEDFHRLSPFLKTVPMHVKQMIYRAGEPVRTIYFPNGGVVSITTTLRDGTMVESSTVGDEGMLGIEAFFVANAVASGDTFMQVPDTDAQAISVDQFRRAIGQRGAFHDIVGRYAQVTFAQLMQGAVCNLSHPVQQRCARWLLMTHDRMHGHDFNLSHEFLAVMLGVQRPTVSTVAATLQAAGFIRYKYGRINVRDRKGLEAESCECYAVMRAHFDRLT